MEDVVVQYRSSLRSLSCNVFKDTYKANSPKICDLFRPLSAYSICSKGNPVAVYVFYFVFTLSIRHCLVLGGSSYGKCNPFQLVFIRFSVFRTRLYSLT